MSKGWPWVKVRWECSPKGESSMVVSGLDVSTLWPILSALIYIAS